MNLELIEQGELRRVNAEQNELQQGVLGEDELVLIEVGYRQPIDEDSFYNDVIDEWQTVKRGSLKASITRLINKGHVTRL